MEIPRFIGKNNSLEKLTPKLQGILISHLCQSIRKHHYKTDNLVMAAIISAMSLSISSVISTMISPSPLRKPRLKLPLQFYQCKSTQTAKPMNHRTKTCAFALTLKKSTPTSLYPQQHNSKQLFFLSYDAQMRSKIKPFRQ